MKSVTTAVLAVAAAGAQGKTTKPHPRQIFVGVVDRTAAPVVDRCPITYITDAGDTRPVDVGVAREGVRLELAAGCIR